MPEIKVRPARNSDRRPVAEFTARTWVWGDYISSVWRRWMDAGGLFVAEIGGKVVGVVRVSLRAGGEAYIQGARVAPGFRGAGVGRAMTSEALRWASSMGAGFATLATSEDNLPARRVAEALGFRVEQRVVRVSAPRKRCRAPGVRPLSPGEAASLISSPSGVRPVKFDEYSWSTMTPEDAARYAEEGFAAGVGDPPRAAAFYQPWEGPTVMVDFVSGDRADSEVLGLHLRSEAISLSAGRVWGYLRDDDGVISGLRRAGFRVRSRGYLIYRRDLRTVASPA